GQPRAADGQGRALRGPLPQRVRGGLGAGLGPPPLPSRSRLACAAGVPRSRALLSARARSRQDLGVQHLPRVEIHYCPRCRWLMRAAWMAQELLTPFSDELGEVALVPSREAGLFRVLLDDEQLFDRREAGRFP